MNKYKKLTYNTVLMLIGNLSSKLLVFLLLPFYTKYLNPELYGELNMVTATISFLTPILTLEIAASVFRFSNNKCRKEQNKILITSLFGIMPFIFVMLLIGKFIVNYWNIDYLIPYYLIISLIFLFNYTNSVLRENLRTNSKIKIYSIIGILETLCIVSLNILLVPKYKILGMLYSTLFTSIILNIILIIITKLYKKINIKYFNMFILKEMLNYSLPLIPNAVIWWIIGLSDRFFLKYYYGFSEVGLYSLATRFPIILTTIFTVFYSSLQISALDEYKSKDYNKFFNNIFKTIMFILLLCNMGIIFIIKPLMKISVSEVYFESWKYVPILLIATLFNNYSAVLGVNYLALKNSRGVLKSSAIAMIGNLILNYILVPKYSIYGASIATMISYIILFFVRRIDSKKLVEVKLNYKFYLINLIPIFMFLILLLNIMEYQKYFLMLGMIIIFLLLEKQKIIESYKLVKSKFNNLKKG